MLATKTTFVSVNDNHRTIAYDVVSLPIIEEPSNNKADAVDVLLLHGMAPIGRKCWGFKDHANNNSLMKNGKLASENIKTFIKTIQQHSNNEISQVRLIIPDRPGYCDSDVAPSVKEKSRDEDNGATQGYSYEQFATDMLTVIEHATADGVDDDVNTDYDVNQPRKRLLIILGTSSGGPCSLSLRNRILSQSSSLRNHNFIGTIVCSPDCPYSHPQCPQAVIDEDTKDLNGRSIFQYAQDESLKRFRKKSKHGFVTDYLLERSDWGFDLGFDLAAPHVSSDGAHHSGKAVHIYIGGENDHKAIRLGAPFLKHLIGNDARLEVLDEEDHFYASRKPDILAKLIATLMRLQPR
jgi:pimeloyl-ACP methyl ester carboxylesterase